MLKFSQYLKLNLANQMNLVSWELDLYNDLVMLVELNTALSVFTYLSYVSSNKWYQKLNHWGALELLWTLFPVSVLVVLGCPSLKMLYMQELYQFSSNLSVKVLGYQWYWSYDFLEWSVSLDSFPKMFSNLYRLGESELLVLPVSFNIRLLISSEDVIHSWTIPSLGVKMDATPGRLNFINILNNQPSKFIGQCSELCGNFHSWMPIYVEFSSTNIFIEWCKIYKI
uniref:Cytochrome c oxidase subunit 2 n=1 Tax=Thaumamermis cosgrovei TaxID=382538 RepID=Q1HBE1_THACS|nr:cytochrome c oxidase subunit II [Thaumamermis cosgrovei]ABF48143.1 cytochrome c oxidase subunit 2 [Thaumamermis cosgrovei]ABF48155.1 cytochrome c oxidase subunit 2 [Thaumamermis cosgrovei]